jgi:hypothetical protein
MNRHFNQSFKVNTRARRVSKTLFGLKGSSSHSSLIVVVVVEVSILLLNSG